MREKIIKIVKALERGAIDEMKAEKLLLDLFIVSGSLLSDENLERAISITAEINKEKDWVWGYDTVLGTPKDILQEFKDVLTGNDR